MGNKNGTMSAGEQLMDIQAVPLSGLAEALGHTRTFADVPVDALQSIGDVEQVKAKAGTTLAEPGQGSIYYWLVLDGECRAERIEADGSYTTVGTAQAGEAFGETPFLTGKTHATFLVTAVRDTDLLRFSAAQFWALMACCPGARKVILADMS